MSRIGDWLMKILDCTANTPTVPAITLISPNGGESWLALSTHFVTWSSVGEVGPVHIEVTYDSGNNWADIIDSTPNSGSYSWTLAAGAKAACTVRISQVAGGTPTDSSNAPFAITVAVEPVVKCDIPYHTTGKILCYTGAMLTELCMKDGAGWVEAEYGAYLDVLVADGVNAIRSFTQFEDTESYWDSWKYGDSAFFTHLKARLQMIKDRDLTAILCLRPFAGSYIEAQYKDIIAQTVQFLPNIIYETINEPRVADNDLQVSLVQWLQAAGVPTTNIQLGHTDSSSFFNLLQAIAPGLATYHWAGTMDTINYPKPSTIGWAVSSGMMELMANGLYGSNDGPDAAEAAAGSYFYQLDPTSRRPTSAQLEPVVLWMLQHGYGFEHLCASAFLNTLYPVMADAVSYGAEYRQAMRSAYDSFVS